MRLRRRFVNSPQAGKPGAGRAKTASASGGEGTITASAGGQTASCAILCTGDGTGENIDTTLAKVEGMMRTIVAAFEKQLDSLYGAEALDISTDITVLENMMAREGLSDDPIHQTQKETPAAEEKESGEDGDGIQLEL